MKATSGYFTRTFHITRRQSPPGAVGERGRVGGGLSIHTVSHAGPHRSRALRLNQHREDQRLPSWFAAPRGMPFEIVSNCLEPPHAIRRLKTVATVPNCSKLFQTIANSFEHFQTHANRFKQLQTVLNSFKQFPLVPNRCIILKLLGNVGN
jgi:hypothetical protein